ncbi:retrovirus-related pol polyprotein from transposon TNT 1-94, partial [Tanacetum coccineum]
ATHFQDILCTAMHVDVENKCVLPANDETLIYADMEKSYIDEYSSCLELEAKLSKKKDMCKESVQNDRPCKNQDAPKFQEFFEISELKDQLQKKNTTITNLKDHIAKLKGKRTIRFRNDQVATIMGYDDYQIGNVTISRVYYVEGLGHNLFSVGQFCDSDLESATTCYTQNQSLIRTSYNKTPYELMHDRKPDLKYLLVFGSLCYPTNDSEDLGKLKPKSDIGPELQLMTPGTISLGLPSPSVASHVPPAVAPIPTDTTDTATSTSIDQDAPSASTSLTTS